MGRPFGGVAILVSRPNVLLSVCELTHAAEHRLAILKVGYINNVRVMITALHCRLMANLRNSGALE